MGHSKDLRKKSVVPSIIILILGVIGVSIAATVYPIWQHNREALAWNEALGVATQDMYDTVTLQTFIVIFGFIIGISFIIGGIYLLNSIFDYNIKIGQIMRKRERNQSHQQYTIKTIEHPSFCPKCGKPVTNQFCGNCGNRIY